MDTTSLYFFQELSKDLHMTRCAERLYISQQTLSNHIQRLEKELGCRLFLDSGTLTPLLKKLEAKGLVTRRRSSRDERNLIVEITDEGKALKDRALAIPAGMAKCLVLNADEALTLYRLLYKMLGREVL